MNLEVSYCRWKISFRYILKTRDFYRGTLALIKGLGFLVFIRRYSKFSCNVILSSLRRSLFISFWRLFPFLFVFSLKLRLNFVYVLWPGLNLKLGYHIYYIAIFKMLTLIWYKLAQRNSRSNRSPCDVSDGRIPFATEISPSAMVTTPC